MRLKQLCFIVVDTQNIGNNAHCNQVLIYWKWLGRITEEQLEEAIINTLTTGSRTS